MKSLFLITVFCLLLISCSNENTDSHIVDLSGTNGEQTWVLTTMTGNTADSRTEGADMVWQESYSFKNDDSFVKTRIIDGVKKTISGTYNIINSEDESGYVLKYAMDSDLIGSCEARTEYLYFNEEKDTLLSNWWACDGPGLFYNRQN